MTRVLHVSDLHFGTHEDRDLERAVPALLERIQPGARDRERRPDAPGPARTSTSAPPGSCARSARRCSRSPGTTTSRTPSPPASRRPWREFERLWETTEPTYSSDGLFVLGLNSVRPWRHQSGALRREHLRRACETLSAAPDERVQDRRVPPPPARRAVALDARSRSPIGTACSRRSSTPAPS